MDYHLAALQRKATAALILAICSMTIVPLLPAFPAIVFGVQARRGLTRYPDAPGGGRALAAIGLGVSALILGSVALLLVLS